MLHLVARLLRRIELDEHLFGRVLRVVGDPHFGEPGLQKMERTAQQLALVFQLVGLRRFLEGAFECRGGLARTLRVGLQHLAQACFGGRLLPRGPQTSPHGFDGCGTARLVADGRRHGAGRHGHEDGPFGALAPGSDVAAERPEHALVAVEQVPVGLATEELDPERAYVVGALEAHPDGAFAFDEAGAGHTRTDELFAEGTGERGGGRRCLARCGEVHARHLRIERDDEVAAFVVAEIESDARRPILVDGAHPSAGARVDLARDLGGVVRGQAAATHAEQPTRGRLRSDYASGSLTQPRLFSS